MSENTQMMKHDRERRYAILITALQDFMGADTRYTNELESLLSVEKKVVEEKKTESSKRERLVQKARRKKEELEKREGEEKREEKT